MANYTTQTSAALENSSSSRNSSYLEDVTSNIVVQIVFCVFYGNIFVLGIFGNVLVCYVVARNRHMHTVTNFFITNLALSDVLLCVLAVPFTPLYTFLGRWVFGNTLCHLVPYAQGVSVYISTLTLTSIAMDRFLVIIYPFHPRMKIEMCVAIILSIWVVALLVTLPYGIYMQLEEPHTYCEEHWPSEPFRKVFSSITSILQFAVPFFVIAFCYVCVSIKLNDRARSKPGSKSSKREEADRERKRRTNRMLIAMVAIFGISWLPLNIINVVEDFYSPANDWYYYRLCFFMTHCLAMSSTCYNPFLYAWLNDNFRKEFKQRLCGRSSSSRKRRVRFRVIPTEQTCRQDRSNRAKPA
ncbi:prolactin-releasing peptide receptor-like isoform X2 [Odontomachus brunneus]|uniref:prolactin-releasing peptide receptor-like isoform X2 n=1 Tax=Odontomachus brunneus TaxID=486640 RepID=UPI0013F20978|nr:prolactin-releasing peptide receptor-like isoform X2 [Odontomachus brunneus]